MSDLVGNIIKPMVRGAYSIQKVRIETGNRIVANFKSKLGQKPSTKESTMDKKAKQLLDDLRQEYKRIADAIGHISIKNFRGDNIISSYAEFALISQYNRLLIDEKANFNELNNILTTIPIYKEFFLEIKGVGPAMAGVLIAEIDIHKAKYASSLWKYAGLDVVHIEDIVDGKVVIREEGRSRKKDHQIDIEYINSKGEKVTRKGITFNRRLKDKLLGALAPTFLKIGAKEKKAGRSHKYSEIYYNYRHRIENSKKHKEKTKAHQHNMAIRYMIKIFLADLYEAWRPLEGLVVHQPYSEAKLGHQPHAAQ